METLNGQSPRNFRIKIRKKIKVKKKKDPERETAFGTTSSLRRKNSVINVEIAKNTQKTALKEAKGRLCSEASGRPTAVRKQHCASEKKIIHSGKPVLTENHWQLR